MVVLQRCGWVVDGWTAGLRKGGFGWSELLEAEEKMKARTSAGRAKCVK